MLKNRKKLRVKRMVNGTWIDITCKDQKEADSLNELVDQLQTPRLGCNQNEIKVSLARAVCGVLDDKKEDGLDYGTIKGVMKPIRLFKDYLMKEDVSAIPPHLFLEAFVNARNVYSDEVLAYRTLENYALTFKEILSKAVELGAAKIDVKKIMRPILSHIKTHGVLEKEYTSYSFEEIDTWLNSPETLDKWVRLYVRASLNTFKRQGELLAIGWPDVNWDTKKIYINKQVTGGRFKWGLKSGGAAHYIDIDDELYDVLISLKKWQEDNGIKSQWVFASPVHHQSKSFPSDQKCPYVGKPVSRMLVNLRVQDDMAKSGIKVKKIHDLRRTAATLYFLSSKHDYKTTMLILKKRLNHESLLTTEKYISVSAEYLKSIESQVRPNNDGASQRIHDLEERRKVLLLEQENLKLQLENKKLMEELEKKAA